MAKKIVRITADRPGLNRGGIEHPEGTSEYPRADFTDQQIEHFKLEPWLEVEEVEIPEAGDPDPDKATKGGGKGGVKKPAPQADAPATGETGDGAPGTGNGEAQ